VTPEQAGFTAIDTLADAYHRRGGQPGLAYGIVAGGALVHARGLGCLSLEGPAPDAGTVFRIASMTKSFTAAAVLALRDDGALALDDPVGDYVPQVRSLPLPAPDCAPLTIRNLLTMTAGFPADDPWGDRQQGLPLGDFAALLEDGVRFAFAPGLRFEYSNVGYALLGAVITAASGQSYPDFVTARLLRPLGMTATGFEEKDFLPERLARGYRRDPGGWCELPMDPCGAFAPMGGIFACVADLARWVAGFTAAFPPGAQGEGGPHPLARATRRQMQFPHVTLPPPGLPPLPDGRPWHGQASYGFGLFVADDPVLGRLVAHSGGYPGFGSHMRWHPATGRGVIVLANGTYAPVTPLAAAMLEALLRLNGAHPGASAAAPPASGPLSPAPEAALSPAPEAALSPAPEAALSPAPEAALSPAPEAPLSMAPPWPATVAAREEVSRLLAHWDDAAADRLFTENVAWDDPYPARRAKLAQIREVIGEFTDDPARPPRFDTPARCRWWLRGERGLVQAEIELNPQDPPRVMAVRLAVPPAPGSPLGSVLGELVALLNAGAPGWPGAIAVPPTLDTGLLVRRLRMAAAWAGSCTVDGFRAGDGTASVTAELSGEHARLVLAVGFDPVANELHQVDVLVVP
jgi:serine-type D-Ala-D-Ala carboxypeptidase/endopeptidase